VRAPSVLFVLLAGTVLAYSQVAGQAATSAAGAGYTITRDSTYDEFEDREPKAYLRLARVATTAKGVTVRLTHSRCSRSLMSDEPIPAHTLIVEVAESELPGSAKLVKGGGVDDTIPVLGPINEAAITRLAGNQEPALV